MSKTIAICIISMLTFSCIVTEPPIDWSAHYIVNNSQYKIVVELTKIQRDSTFKSNPIAINSADTILKDEMESSYFLLTPLNAIRMDIYHYLENEKDTLLYTQMTNKNISLWKTKQHYLNKYQYLIVNTFEFNDSYITK